MNELTSSSQDLFDRDNDVNRTKSAFLANMSHEIRTPLNAILGFSRLMMRDSNLTDSQEKYLSIINRSGKHLLDLINDVLEMSKIEAGRMKVNTSSFEFSTLLDDLQDMFHLQAREKDISLVLNKLGEIPDWIVTDGIKVRQVLINLLGNAVKFTEHGAITLHISSVTEERNVRIIAEVEDTGPGIREEERDKLFRSFEQTESGMLSNGGTGLGLPISREYARLLGGDITVTSRPGYGSVFRFEFDAILSSEKVMADRTPDSHVVDLQDKEREYSVLVSDDISSNRLLLQDLLASIGFRVFMATNGLETIKVFQAEKPDIILMDNRMPDITGQEATRRIRQLPEGKDVGIIAISATVFDDDRDEILSAGADELVRKPVEEEQLFDAMQRILGIKYLYEGDSYPTEKLDLPACREALAALPVELTKQMRRLILEGDLEELGNLLDQVQPHNRHLSEVLHILINRFELKKLQTIFL